MKAIKTKYKGPTNTRGSRIIASDEDGNRIAIPYPYELSGEDCHSKAAYALCEKMNWKGKLVGGSVKNGYIFVFSTGWGDCCRAATRLADLACATFCANNPKARQVFPTATWAEIIASELNVEIPE